MPRSAQTISHFSPKEISQLFKKARRVLTHPGLHILVAPANQSLGRVLVVTSRKIGNAPTRNKIRRQLKAIFYEEKLYEKGADCVVIVKLGGPNLDFPHLKELLLKAFAIYATTQTHPSTDRQAS